MRWEIAASGPESVDPCPGAEFGGEGVLGVSGVVFSGVFSVACKYIVGRHMRRHLDACVIKVSQAPVVRLRTRASSSRRTRH